ncbi:hypothetical protein GE061_004273 [Apolygus lucorum]|uniref:Uncharacterized protein n=1 Tax=Apolygus lucorum TaxID=248454 RepID=A0A8S9WYU0_APOLU|nr:hypothetical protein GE061_004273 [Apolygus lucorum]
MIKSNKPIDPSVDRGKWLTAKAVDNRRSCLNEAHSSHNFDAFPVAGWKSFPSILIPDQFHYGLIKTILFKRTKWRMTRNQGSLKKPETYEDSGAMFSSWKILCSHVIALLQALDDYVLLYGYTPPPCTSAVCQ